MTGEYPFSNPDYPFVGGMHKQTKARVRLDSLSRDVSQGCKYVRNLSRLDTQKAQVANS